MRLHVLQLYFLTFNHYIWSTDGIDIEELKDIITGVSVLDDKGSSIDIDDDHKQSNPECGYLPEEPKDQSACSRISNAEESNRISSYRLWRVDNHLNYCHYRLPLHL